MASILQLIPVVSAIVGTLGLTTLYISLRERREIAKENKRERFAKLVLTNDLFALLNALWRLHEVGNAALEIKANGSGMIFVDGVICRFTDVTKLEAELDKLLDQVPAKMTQVKESGSFFLAPDNIRHAIGETGIFFEKIELEKIDKQFLGSYSNKLVEIQKLLRKEAGLE